MHDPFVYPIRPVVVQDLDISYIERVNDELWKGSTRERITGVRVYERGCILRFQVGPLQSLFDDIVHDRAMLLLQLGIIFEIPSKIRRHSNKPIQLVIRFARPSARQSTGGTAEQHTNDFPDLGPCQAMIIFVELAHQLLIPFTQIEEKVRAFGRPLVFGNISTPVRYVFHYISNLFDSSLE